MTRLPFHDEPRLPVNIFRVMAHAPEIERGYLSLGGRLLGQSSLDAKLRELVICAISVKLDAPYEWSHHAKPAMDNGATADELQALLSGDLSALGPLERDCVAYARKVDDHAVTDGDVETLRGHGLSEQAIVELTVLAGFYGMTARFLLAMDVELDDPAAGRFDVP